MRLIVVCLLFVLSKQKRLKEVKSFFFCWENPEICCCEIMQPLMFMEVFDGKSALFCLIFVFICFLNISELFVLCCTSALINEKPQKRFLYLKINQWELVLQFGFTASFIVINFRQSCNSKAEALKVYYQTIKFYSQTVSENFA